MTDDLVSSPSPIPTDPLKPLAAPETPSIAVSGDSISTPPPNSPEAPPPHIVSPLSGGKSRVKIILSAIALLLFLASIPTAILLIQQRQEIRERAAIILPAGESCTPGDYDRICSGQCGGCDPDAGEQLIYQCNSEGTAFDFVRSECSLDCAGPCGGGGGCQNPDGNEGDWRYECTGNQGSCADDAGVGVPYRCENGTWANKNPECTTQCDIIQPTPGPETWYQCSETNRQLPCGSCLVTSVGPGTMTFSCELDCGGLASNCPGGSAGSYSIAHRWERCRQKGTGACTGSSSDYLDSDDLGGPGLWAISGQSTVNGSGTFPNPGCGRVQVDVQMSAQGTNVAADVYDTGKDCLGAPTPTPTPTPVAGICEPISTSVTPSTVVPGGSLTFTATSNYPYGYVGVNFGGGATETSFSCTDCSSPAPYRWDWTGIAGTSGSYTATFSGKKDGITCTASTPYTVALSITAQCLNIKAYDLNWNLLDATKLSQLKFGDKVRFAVLGTTTQGTFEKARFRVNTDIWTETTTKKPGTEEFYIEYTLLRYAIPEATTFKVEAELYHSTLGWQ